MQHDMNKIISLCALKSYSEGTVLVLYLRVTLHRIDECFISYNLSLSIEKGLEAVLGLLKLLLGYLRKQRKGKIEICQPYFISN